jgi:hypothetical protein
MSDATPREGHCRCGRVRMLIRANLLLTMACHCRGCQRMTASAFSLSALFPATALEIATGEVADGGLQGASRHRFCAFCKSWLFTHPEGLPHFVSVRSTLFDDARLTTPFIETCTDEKLVWASTAATHSFTKFPQPTQLGPLLEEFRQLVAESP